MPETTTEDLTAAYEAAEAIYKAAYEATQKASAEYKYKSKARSTDPPTTTTDAVNAAFAASSAAHSACKDALTALNSARSARDKAKGKAAAIAAAEKANSAFARALTAAAESSSKEEDEDDYDTTQQINDAAIKTIIKVATKAMVAAATSEYGDYYGPTRPEIPASVRIEIERLLAAATPRVDKQGQLRAYIERGFSALYSDTADDGSRLVLHRLVELVSAATTNDAYKPHEAAADASDD